MKKLNMNKKLPLRLLGALLAALLVLAVFPINALADTQVALALDVAYPQGQTYAIAGDEVTVTVSIGDTNPGIASMCFDLEYDKTVFTLKENSAEILGEFKTNSGSLELMEGNQGKANLEAISEQDETVTFNWIYSGALNSGSNGAQDCTLSNVAFAKLVFIVKEGVTENKNVNFVLKPSEENIFSIVGGMSDVPVTGYTDNVAKTIVKSVTVKKSYTVTYNANGGNGAPAAQKKVDGVALTLSETVPTRGGYKFLGWARNENATAKEYDSGDTSFNINDDTTLFAVWQRNNSTLAVGDSVGVAGGTVTVPVTIGTADMSATSVKITVTAGGLTFNGAGGWEQNGDEISKTFNPAEVFQNGSMLVNLKFEIPQGAGINAKYTVSIAANIDDDFEPTITKTGAVKVVDYILGDVNGDGYVNAADSSLILQHYVGTYTLSDVGKAAADVNHDTYINAADSSLILQSYVGTYVIE